MNRRNKSFNSQRERNDSKFKKQSSDFSSEAAVFVADIDDDYDDEYEEDFDENFEDEYQIDPEVEAFLNQHIPSKESRQNSPKKGAVKKREPQPKKEYLVTEEGQLLDLLFKVMADKSKTTVKSYLKHRQIAINHTITTKFDASLKVGDKVVFNPATAEEEFRHPMLRIVYEDDYLLVVDKKNGLLSMASDRERTKTAYFILSDYLKAKESSSRIFIVHRLDRETSGLMLFAKSVEVQHALQKNWNQMVLERKYVAVVKGGPKSDSGEIRTYLAENSAYMVYSTHDSTKGELAITNFEVLKRGKNNTLVELELETGKKNQIRVHMKDIGCPIVGDKKYGGPKSDINRIALHARKIRFIHPVTKEEMNFDTAVPAPFNKLLK